MIIRNNNIKKGDADVDDFLSPHDSDVHHRSAPVHGPESAWNPGKGQKKTRRKSKEMDPWGVSFSSIPAHQPRTEKRGHTNNRSLPNRMTKTATLFYYFLRLLFMSKRPPTRWIPLVVVVDSLAGSSENFWVDDDDDIKFCGGGAAAVVSE